MTTVAEIPSHLAQIDAALWPRVSEPPIGVGTRRADKAEAYLAATLERLGLSADPAAEKPDLVIDRVELFDRLAVDGWTGFAESYLAGEWRTGDLAGLLVRLIGGGFLPQKPLSVRLSATHSGTGWTGGELPPTLVALSTGGYPGFGAPRFASSVATTVRTSLHSYVPGAGRGREPATHFVDVTTMTDPVDPAPEDLPEALARATDRFLDRARVGSRTDTAVWPATSAAVPLAAAARGAAVDCLTTDQTVGDSIADAALACDLGDAVRVVDLPRPLPDVREIGSYPAVFCAGALSVAGRCRRTVLKTLDRLTDPRGTAAVEAIITTPQGLNPVAHAATEMLSEYVWPAWQPVGLEELHKDTDRLTGLRITAVTHLGNQWAPALKFAQVLFAQKEREAAAAGFDPVYRRLWEWTLALQEALVRLGMLDIVHLTFTHRRRG